MARKATIAVHAVQQILEDPDQNPSVIEVQVYDVLLQPEVTSGGRTMKTMPSKDLERALVQRLRALRMPRVRNSFPETATLARQESLSVQPALLAPVEQKQQSRTNHHVQRYLRTSHSPREKTPDQSIRTRLPVPINHQVSTLLEGGLLGRSENV